MEGTNNYKNNNDNFDILNKKVMKEFENLITRTQNIETFIKYKNNWYLIEKGWFTDEIYFSKKINKNTFKIVYVCKVRNGFLLINTQSDVDMELIKKGLHKIYLKLKGMGGDAK